ncbi:MAG: TonB-dependent receptor [Verrucomicrobia bacterium]|nr:TonB-dependent receptor [Verrucomicrobiota bacterium]
MNRNFFQYSLRSNGAAPSLWVMVFAAAACLWLWLWLWTGSVEGGVVNRNGNGPRSSAMAGADIASESDPMAAIGRNPALLSTMESPHLTLSAMGALGTGDYRNKYGESFDFDQAGGFPEAAIAFPVGDSPVSIGLGFGVVAAKEVDWRYRDVDGGAGGAASYGFLEHSSRFLMARTAAALSYAVNDQLSLGMSGGLVYEEFQLQAPFIFQSNPILKSFKTALDLDTDGYSGNAEAGMLFRPTDRLSLGLTYRSPTPITSEGRADGTLDAQLASLGITGFDSAVHYDAEVETAFPQAIAGGIAWKVTDRLLLAGQVEWVNWSDAYDTLDITLRNGTNNDLKNLAGREVRDSVPLHWEDQLVFRTGAEYELTGNLMLRAGYAFGASPMPDELVTPVNAAISEHLISAGIGCRIGSCLIDLAYQYELPRSVETGNSGYQAGEYSDSRLRISSHWVNLGFTFEF